MPNPVFPTLPSGSKLDSSKFGEEIEDPAMRTDMEGGYVVSRAKHTRIPRATWSCAYTYIDNADRQVLREHWNTVRGGSVVFDWLNPQDGQTYQVRFKGGPIKFTYVGIGDMQRWDASFQLEQA